MSDVARTILEQLGGNRFITMTGARNFIGSENSLSFRLPGAGGFCKNGINAVRIELMPSDTYRMSFSRIRGSKLTAVAQHDDIYFDGLQELFTSETGLATSLGKVTFA
jgi:hypothetical protein